MRVVVHLGEEQSGNAARLSLVLQKVLLEVAGMRVGTEKEKDSATKPSMN